MNDLTSNSIWIDHPIRDKDGTTHIGFFAYFQRVGQEQPTRIQHCILTEKSEQGYITFFGTVEETFARVALYER